MAETVKSLPSPPMTPPCAAHPDPSSLLVNSLGPVIGLSKETCSSPIRPLCLRKYPPFITKSPSSHNASRYAKTLGSKWTVISDNYTFAVFKNIVPG